MIRGLIIGHSEFAKAMLGAAESIVGEQPDVDIISNVGLSCELLDREIDDFINRSKHDEIIIFVDLPGGSCTISCFHIFQKNKNLNIICGINLPMLIEFFMLREKYTASELVPILINKGRENIFQLKEKI